MTLKGTAGPQGKFGDIASFSTQQVPGLSCFASKALQGSLSCQNQKIKKRIPAKFLNLIFPRICLLPVLSLQHSPSRSL